MLKLIKKYQFGGGSSWATSSYSNPYQYKGLSTSFQNRTAASNLSSLKVNAGGSNTGGSNTGKTGGINAGKFNNTMNTITNIGTLLTSALGNETSSQTNSYNLGYMAISDALSGTPAGWILKLGAIGSEIGYALGDKTDQVTPEDLFLDSYFSRITPGGWYNIATTRKADKLLNGANEMLTDLGSGYGDIMTRYDKVKDLADKRIGNAWGLLDRANARINSVNSGLVKMKSIWDKTTLDKMLTALMEDRWNQATINNLNGGFGNIYRAKQGFKFDILPKVHAILNKPRVVDTLTEWEETPIFKEGGKMNVIPEGHLHARLHHMENADNLTKKGVPVVSIAEGGEFELQAEIELNEIIFRLEVTKELEKLMEDGSDNAAVEAGKLLVKEIFENTDDRTGLLKDLEPEKKESSTEDIVKNHQVFQEGGSINKSNKSIERPVDYKGIIEKLDTLSEEELQELRKYLKIEEA